MQRTANRIISLALAGVLAGCGPNAGGAGRADCTSTNAITQVTGECTRTLATLNEPRTEHVAVRTSDVQPFATVAYEVSVESGAVIVIFSDIVDSELTAAATPGQPARGQARVRLDPLNQINFGLAPVEGTATGVTYHVTFVCDCLP